MNRERKDTVLRVVPAVAVLGLCLVVWLLARKEGPELSDTTNQTSIPTNMVLTPPVLATSTGSRSVRVNAAGAAMGSTNAAQTRNARVDRETMLRQLKGWIRKREGYDAEIVTAQDVLDVNGNPASMNVIVTTRLNGGLTAQKLKVQLDDAIEKERALRIQLAKAQQVEDVGGVNRLVAELVESRGAFITSNGVSSYKLSLLKDLPPVLAFWPGLPFETVREGSARSLAEAKLGPDIGFDTLVHFTGATALLQFTNRAGASVCVDPFRMTEISLATLQALSQRRIQRDDEGRESRIASQWADYLQQ